MLLAVTVGLAAQILLVCIISFALSIREKASNKEDSGII